MVAMATVMLLLATQMIPALSGAYMLITMWARMCVELLLLIGCNFF
jgi:hypothetical protein